MFLSKNINRLIISFSCLGVFFTGAAFAGKYQSVEDMLAAQKTIRVLIDIAAGFGNQAATVNMMNRVRQMHFDGTYEVIYPDMSKDKVISLFNLPKDLPAVYHYRDANKGNIDFILESHYMKQLKSNSITPISLSFSGAHDSDSITDCYDKPDCDTRHDCDEGENCTRYDNFAKYTKASVHVELQPWYNQYQEGSDYIAVPEIEHKIMVKPPGKYWIYPFAKFADTKNFLENTQEGRDFESKHSGLKSLINRINQQEVNFLSLYGYTFLKQYNKPDNHKYTFPQNILQVMTAARFVQATGGEFAKPLVVAVYYNYQTEIDELKKLLNSNNWGEYESIGGEQAREAIRAVKLNDPKLFSMASIGDTDVDQKIQSLAPGQVMLLATGPLPKVVFDGLYSYTGTNSWPAIREGEGSLSMLLQTGLPHFRCSTYYDHDNEDIGSWEISFDLVKDPGLEKQLRSFYGVNGFCDVDSWKTNPGIYKQLGTFIMDAKRQSSPISQYFVDLKEDTMDLQNDRVYRGLEEAVKVLG